MFYRKENNMTQGFCTIATGDYKYSKLAYNLLMSYRRFTEKKYRFAVITDKTNELLENFDDVVVINESSESFLDKLLLFQLCPYDETIFIDADSLAYGDLDRIFDYFKDADDISCLGEIFPLNSKNAWFRIEDVEDYRDRIEYTVWLHGGIYFIRKNEKMYDFFNTCQDIAKNYKKFFFRFKYLTEPADEPIVALAMAIHKYHPIKERPEIMAFYRDSKIKKIDIISGKLSYTVKSGSTDKGLLVHWATSNTKRALYCIEEKKLEWILKKKKETVKLFFIINMRFRIEYILLKWKDFITERKERNCSACLNKIDSYK